MNKWIGMGRLVRDPEIMSGNTTVAKYTIAVDRRFSKEKETDFINCVCFGKAAEFAEKYLKKGTKVVVTGRIQTGSYENKEGQKVRTFDIIVEDQEFAESKGTSEQTPAPANDDFMTISDTQRDDMPF